MGAVICRNESNTEHVHRLFRGASEFAKAAAAVAFCTEVVAALVAGWRALVPDVEWSGWASLALAAVLAGGVSLRLCSKRARSFSERCRRVAIRAYAFDKELSGVVATSLSADAPLGTIALSEKLPTQSLHDYYESTVPPGNARLRELYAHSAFYTWRLLCFSSKVYMFFVVGFAAVGLLIVYDLAASAPPDPSVADRLLDVVCSVVFVFLVARATEAYMSAKESAAECRRVTEDLAAEAGADRLQELTADYDTERASGPAIPTLVYKAMRDELQTEWHKRRLDLGRPAAY